MQKTLLLTMSKREFLDNHCIELLANHLVLNGLIFLIVLLVMMRPLRE